MSFVKNIILTYKNNTLIYLRFFAAFDFLSDSKTNGYRFWQFRCGFSVKRPSLSRGGGSAVTAWPHSSARNGVWTTALHSAPANRFFCKKCNQKRADKRPLFFQQDKEEVLFLFFRFLLSRRSFPIFRQPAQTDVARAADAENNR